MLPRPLIPLRKLASSALTGDTLRLKLAFVASPYVLLCASGGTPASMLSDGDGEGDTEDERGLSGAPLRLNCGEG